jgi:hypothetical protein
MIFSRSTGEKPPLRASSAKRSRIGERLEKRGTKNVIVEAAQITKIRNSNRLAISFRVLNFASCSREKRGIRRCAAGPGSLIAYFAPLGLRAVMTSVPVWAQNAPLVPMAGFVELGQLVQYVLL